MGGWGAACTCDCVYIIIMYQNKLDFVYICKNCTTSTTSTSSYAKAAVLNLGHWISGGCTTSNRKCTVKNSIFHPACLRYPLSE